MTIIDDGNLRKYNAFSLMIQILINSASQSFKDCITLGNLDSTRDWGHAKDYVKGMYLIMQAEKPEDYVLATGKSYSVRYFVERAFK
jgi:GDP-D-mannose dehydratase